MLEVNESIIPEAPVFTVLWKDPDRLDYVSCEIVEESSTAEFYVANATAVFLAEAIDFESRDIKSLTVNISCNDNSPLGPIYSHLSREIALLNVNERYEFCCRLQIYEKKPT